MNGGEEDEQESDTEEGSENGSDETDEIVEEGDDLRARKERNEGQRRVALS